MVVLVLVVGATGAVTRTPARTASRSTLDSLRRVARAAKHRALGQKIDKKWEGGAALAVLNTSYMLTAANYARTMRRYDLVVVDECDMMEGALIGFIEYSVPGWIGKLVHLQAPKKSVRKPTLIKWLGETADLVSEWVADNPGRLEVKKMNKLRGFIDETRTTAKYLQLDVDAAARHADDDSDGDQAGRWIRDYGDSYHPVQYLKLRPVTVSQHGPKHLWRHGTKFLFMSGTVISSDELGDSLGLPLDYATVTIPSSFPVENRPIILAPVANVTARAEDRDYEALIYAVEQIADWSTLSATRSRSACSTGCGPRPTAKSRTPRHVRRTTRCANTSRTRTRSCSPPRWTGAWTWPATSVPCRSLRSVRSRASVTSRYHRGSTCQVGSSGTRSRRCATSCR